MPANEPVRSRANPLYKRLRALLERGAADELCLLEGPRLVLEALAAGLRLVAAAVAPRAEATPLGRAALTALGASRVPIHHLTAELLGSLSETETSQGVLALARRPSFDEELLFRGTPLLLVADSVQNPGNLGALLRTAEAAGASGGYLTSGCADPLSWKALRGAMGSAFRLPHVRGMTMDAVLQRLASRDVAVLATAADGETRYDQADLRRPVAVLVGAEGAGLDQAVLARADARVYVPVTSPVESLNVGVAAALVLYEAARQRGFAARVAPR